MESRPAHIRATLIRDSINPPGHTNHEKIMTTNITYAQYMSDASEIGTLEHLLRGIPDSRAIERVGLQSRLDRIRKRLDGVPVPPRPKQLYVSFNGQPVVGSYGINANFAANAINIFTDTFRATTSRTGELTDRGQVPKSPLSQLLITDTANGSFGFVMEMPLPEGDPHGFSYPEEAFNLLQELLRVTKDGDDDALSAAMVTLHPRAVHKVAAFLNFLRKQKAQFATNYRGNEVRFETDTEIANAAARLAHSNTQIQTNDVVGTIISIIPHTRFFRLHTNDGNIIQGQIGPEIREPHQIAQQYTHQRVKVQIRTARISLGTPSHSLVRVYEEPHLSVGQDSTGTTSEPPFKR